MSAQILATGVGLTVTDGFVTATAIGGGSAAALRAVSTGPGIEIRDTDAVLDEKSWDFLGGGGTLLGRAVNDANSAATTWMQVERTGTTIDSVAFPSSIVTAKNLKTHALIENRSPNDTTVSATFVTLESASPVVFSGRPVLFLLSAGQFAATFTAQVEYAIQIDNGSDNVIAQFFHNAVGDHESMSGFVILTPAPGSRTIRLRWRRKAGTGTITQDINDQRLVFAVEL